MESITSAANPKIKFTASLRDSRQRKKSGRTLVDGLRELQYAMDSGVQVETLFVTLEATKSYEVGLLVERLEAHPSLPMIYEIPESLFEKIGYGERRAGVVAVIATPSIPLTSLEVSSDAIVLILDRIEKPGNLGAILRTADAAGIDAVLLSDPIVEPFNPNAIRSSQGAVFSVPMATGGANEIKDWLLRKQLKTYAARVDGPTFYCDVAWRAGSAIVLGNEAEGVGQAWRSEEIIPIRLPMQGTMDSLNVSVAAGILMYETWRQRNR